MTWIAPGSSVSVCRWQTSLCPFQGQFLWDLSAGRPNYTMPGQEKHVPFVPYFEGHSGTGCQVPFPKEKGPEGPFFVDLGGGPKPTSHTLLAEERHELVDHRHEGANVIVSSFDLVATLLHVQVEEPELACRILVDQLRPVASTTRP